MTDTGYAVHHLTSDHQNLKNGKSYEYVKDIGDIKSNIFDKDGIMKHVEGLSKAVVLTQEEMAFVKGISPNGKAITKTETFKEDFEKVKADLKNRTDFYGGISKRMINNIGQVHLLKNIPQDKLSDIQLELTKRNLMDKVVVMGDDLAFGEVSRKAVYPIMEEFLYKDMSPLEKLENELYYRGNGNIELTHPKETTFLISSEDPAFVIAVGPKGFSVSKDGKTVSTMKKDDPAHDGMLLKIAASIKDPVVLSKEEISKPIAEKSGIINSRRTINQTSEASVRLTEQEKIKKEELYGVERGQDGHLDPRQKDALKEYYRHEITDTYVERTFTEKVFDMETGRKLQENSHTTIER